MLERLILNCPFFWEKSSARQIPFYRFSNGISIS